MIANIVVVGGVRRAAMISLSDLNNEQMSRAKSGQWYLTDVHRQLANNSAVYEQKPDVSDFLKEWRELVDSGSGERGIYNRDASRRVVERIGRRDPNHEFGTNPCSEIILRPFQFCNLSEVVVRSGDSLNDLKRKVRLATILGTIQSTFTNFRYLRKVWQKNCDEERLLGVSFTGVADNKRLFRGEFLDELKQVAVETNKEWAERLDIPVAAAVTCVKPSGTVSQLVDSASGLHPRYGAYYVRRVRNDIKDPVTSFLKDAGIPCEVDQRNPSAMVFSFPQKSPDGSTKRGDVSALQALEHWKMFQEKWCEHKPSVTITVKDSEWLAVANWCYDNFDVLSGVSFLPDVNEVYPQAPYEEISKEQYEKMVGEMPEIDWSKLQEYENDDFTTGSQELACTGGMCEI
jgi:ribonucleoside-diphosphate reductase alpha chain